MRLPWDDYFLKMAETACLRSTCLKAQFGAVLTKDHIIISTGYNGAASGVRSCTDIGECIQERQQRKNDGREEICHSVHAEANAIVRASYDQMKDACLYIFGVQDGKSRSSAPCFSCWKLIFNSGIGKVVYLDDQGKKKIVNAKVVDRSRILSYVPLET